jgi:hypothetical protein
MVEPLVIATRESLEGVNPIRQCTERNFVEAMKNYEGELLKVSVG